MSDQHRQAVGELKEYCEDHGEMFHAEALKAALDLIDAQREELELLRPLAPHYQALPRCPTIARFCECPTCTGWREWRRRFGGAK